MADDNFLTEKEFDISLDGQTHKVKATALTRIDPYSLRETESLCRGVGRRFLCLEC